MELPLPETPAHKLDRMISCVSREIKKRRAVYPRLVSAGKMSETQMAYEINTMTDVLTVLQGARKAV